MIRLRILRLLEAQELSVGEVAKVVQLPQSTVSRHLKVLGEGGWLGKRNVGTATLYRLVLDDLSLEARALWLAVRIQMDNRAELSEDGRRLQAVLADRRTDSQAFFGRVAGEWDTVRNELFGDRFTPAALLSLLPRHWTVVDLGCGTGNASELLAPCVAKVLAVDQSPVMLEAARRRLADFSNVEFLEGSLPSLPLADSSADASVCLLVLHHLADPSPAAAEIARILKPGGTVLLVDMVRHDRAEYRQTMGHKHLGFSRQSIESMFQTAGLAELSYRELPGEPDARGPGLFVATASKPAEQSKSSRNTKPAR